MQRKISALWGEKKVILRQTPRAVTPFGGLSVLIEFLGKIGYRQQVREHLPVHLRSPNAIAPEETFTAFLISVLAGARRFAHTALLRADGALHALLGMKRFPTRRHDSELVQAFPAGPGGAVLRAAVGVATGAGAETRGRLQSGLGFDGVRALWGTGGSEARVQPAQAWTGFAPSAAGGVGRSQLYSARLAAEREHAFRQRGGGISEGSDGQAGKPGVDSGGACGFRILCARVIAIPGEL